MNHTIDPEPRTTNTFCIEVQCLEQTKKTGRYYNVYFCKQRKGCRLQEVAIPCEGTLFQRILKIMCVPCSPTSVDINGKNDMFQKPNTEKSDIRNRAMEQ